MKSSVSAIYGLPNEGYCVSNIFCDSVIFYKLSKPYIMEKVHYLAVFDKTDMDRILLMYHLLYTSSSEEIYGGYSLYDYPFPWYHNHLWDGETVFRSPYLPDKLAKYQGIQHYQPVDFFGGEEALLQRQELDKTKKYLCDANDVRLIEWPYSMEPTIGNIKKMLKK